MNRKNFLFQAGALLSGGLLIRPSASGSPLSRADSLPLLKPPRLKEGDTIGMIAPAGIVYDEEQYKRMKSVLEELGFRVRFAPHVRNRHGYLAGRDEERAEDLNRFFADPEIRGIITVRGGWGSNRILSLVDYSLIRDNPKFFCGFSDITSLHLAIHRKTGLVTFHGPNGTSDWTIFTQEQFHGMATGSHSLMLVNPPVEKADIRTIRPGRATGPLLGGNLTLVTSLIGSEYLPSMDGAILFLEDIGEEIYRVDRMFSQLELSGILGRLGGVVFGRCTDCKVSNPGFTLDDVLKRYLDPLGIPAFTGSMISHEPNIFTLPVGVNAEMDAEKGTLRLLEAPVS